MNNAQQWVALIGGTIALPIILAFIAALVGRTKDNEKRREEAAEAKQTSTWKRVELELQTLSVIRSELDAVRAEVRDQKDQITKLQDQVRAGERQIRELRQENVLLKKENTDLKARLSGVEGQHGA